MSKAEILRSEIEFKNIKVKKQNGYIGRNILVATKRTEVMVNYDCEPFFKCIYSNSFPLIQIVTEPNRIPFATRYI